MKAALSLLAPYLRIPEVQRRVRRDSVIVIFCVEDGRKIAVLTPFN